MTAARPCCGTRWGDLDPGQRAALPVGTVLYLDKPPEVDQLVKTIRGWRRPRGSRIWPEFEIDADRTILLYQQVTS